MVIGPRKRGMIHEARRSGWALRLPWGARVGQWLAAIDDEGVIVARAGLINVGVVPADTAACAWVATLGKIGRASWRERVYI